MYYFILNESKTQVVAITTEYPFEWNKDLGYTENKFREELSKVGAAHEICRPEMKTLEEAKHIAEMASKFDDEYDYVAVETGCLPKYDVERCFRVGEPVSYGFNGDSYPAGEVAKISKTGKKITTTTGKIFYRRYGENSTTYKMSGTWTLIRGHYNERNPHI